MALTEKEVRVASDLLKTLDDLTTLRTALVKKDREFYICVQGKDGCLYSDMRLPAETGIAFIDEMIKGLREQLRKVGVMQIKEGE